MSPKFSKILLPSSENPIMMSRYFFFLFWSYRGQKEHIIFLGLHVEIIYIYIKYKFAIAEVSFLNQIETFEHGCFLKLFNLANIIMRPSSIFHWLLKHSRLFFSESILNTAKANSSST